MYVELEEVELASKTNNSAQAWKIVNSITNRKSAPTGKLKGKSPEERKRQWFEHFKNLLGSSDNCPPTVEIEPVLPHVEVADTAFVLEEVVVARKQVKEGKSPGEDDIMSEVLKRINIDDIILDFSNKVFLENKTPEQFSTLNILPIPSL